MSRDLKFVDKGNGDYDLCAGDIVVELSYKDDQWMFWNVRIGADRFGGTQHLPRSTDLRVWLEEQRTQHSESNASRNTDA